MGEAILYSRNNTQKEKYQEQIRNIKLRLAKRGYPTQIINKALHKVKYENRIRYIKQKTSHLQKQPLKCPIFKSIPPARYHHIKQTILSSQPTIFGNTVNNH